MFTPLSKGSERAQDKLWDHTNSPRKGRQRPALLQSPGGPASPWSPSPNLSTTQTTPQPRRPAGGETRHARQPSGRMKATKKGSMIDNEENDSWTKWFFRPGRKTVDKWLSSFWTRHFVLVLFPCIAVWIWVAMPFPVSDPYKDDPFPDWPKRPKDNSTGREGGQDVLPLDVNFGFFLTWYFGYIIRFQIQIYWWPQSLGGKASYFLFWASTLLIGFIAHQFDLFQLRERRKSHDPFDEVDWERKTFWVTLSFVAMLMPALACFSKLKRDKRHVYRHPTPSIPTNLLNQPFTRRIPASWYRFVWFMSALGIACLSVIAGQAVQLLSYVSLYILSSKVRSRALLFVYKLFFQLVLQTYTRNLFARLRSPSQFATVQLLSSISVIILFPLQMTKQYHRLLQIFIGYPQSWEEHSDSLATTFYCRGLAQNVTMVGFLGWLSILHFGPNQQIYPFFRFSPTPDDPYTYSLTFTASLVIWGSELISSFIARQIMSFSFDVDVTNVGLNEMREYPELVPACGWASIHASTTLLLFLCKLNFR
ncbi:hypothetical protein M231_06405 [Tremella mesenterica]|uniref:Uncharacterized protein n=1 Tax=Tremella mesenterica TaxID=5217 RepID=A0A4V1M3B8_TREME|nr:hypothetical protein M231_06405 [Tremella mesenterica]